MRTSGLGKYAQLELERRFLVESLPNGLSVDFRRIEDRYLEGTRLRLRCVAAPDGAPLVFKCGHKPARPEWPATHNEVTNFYLERGEHARLATLPGRTLVKRRHRAQADHLSFSVDVFEGPLEGPMLAELDLPTPEALAAAGMPEFALREVTDDPFFTGAALAEADPEAVLRRVRALASGAT